MSKKLLIVISVFLAIIVLTSGTESSSGVVGYTNSPGETNCTSCHNTYTLNSGTGSVSISSTMSNWQYDLNQTYTVYLKVKFVTRHLFGMDLEVLDGTNHNAGTIVVTNSTQTQTASTTVSGVSRNGITHRTNGGSSQDSMVFTFNWKSPTKYVGNVKFYFAGNCTNANGSSTGDYIYTGSQTVTASPTVTAGINEITGINSLSLFPNPASDKIMLDYSVENEENVTINLYNNSGQLVDCLLSNALRSGNVHESFALNGKYRQGIYFLNVQTENGMTSRKFIIQ